MQRSCRASTHGRRLISHLNSYGILSSVVLLFLLDTSQMLAFAVLPRGVKGNPMLGSIGFKQIFKQCGCTNCVMQRGLKPIRFLQ
jgi:hypothetical protein